MFIDSHCHINFPELAARMPEVLDKMAENAVTHALCVSVNLPDFPQVLAMAEKNPHVFASVGVHPDYEDTPEPSVAQLVALADHPKIVAIGETGLDYFRLTGDLEWQRERFRVHNRSSSTRAPHRRTRFASCRKRAPVPMQAAPAASCIVSLNRSRSRGQQLPWDSIFRFPAS